MSVIAPTVTLQKSKTFVPKLLTRLPFFVAQVRCAKFGYELTCHGGVKDPENGRDDRHAAHHWMGETWQPSSVAPC
jgi:hypothetical protein